MLSRKKCRKAQRSLSTGQKREKPSATTDVKGFSHLTNQQHRLYSPSPKISEPFGKHGRSPDLWPEWRQGHPRENRLLKPRGFNGMWLSLSTNTVMAVVPDSYRLPCSSTQFTTFQTVSSLLITIQFFFFPWLRSKPARHAVKTLNETLPRLTAAVFCVHKFRLAAIVAHRSPACNHFLTLIL